MDLLGKRVSGRDVRVAFDERAAKNKHRIVRRRNPRHSLWYGSCPAGAANQIVAGLGAREAFADVGKIRVVRRIGELDAVVTTAHVRYVQDLRPCPEIQPARHEERVTVRAGGYQVRARDGRGTDRISKDSLWFPV